MNALEPILEATRAEVERRRRGALPPRHGEVRDFLGALQAPGISVIAEHKRRSPSAGTIREELTLEEVVTAYERGGAAALSVLTEGPNFGGSLDDLRRARAVSTLPILRKDFTVDPYQVQEAHAAGADAVLLIVAALEDMELASLHALAGGLGLAALVEVHDEGELMRALRLGPRLLGINNRDLTTLEVDPRRTIELRPAVPEGVIVVAESGFTHAAQLDELAAVGIDAVLVGEGLMRAPDIEGACAALAWR